MRCVRNCSRCPARRSSARTGSRHGSAAAPNGAAPARPSRSARLRGRGCVGQRLRGQQRHRQRRRGARFVAPRTKSSAKQCAGRESMRGTAVQVGAATRVTTARVTTARVTTARATTAWAGLGRQRRCGARFVTPRTKSSANQCAGRESMRGAAVQVGAATRATTARVKTGWAGLGRQRRCGARFVALRTKLSANQCAGRQSLRGAGDPIVCTARRRWSALLSASCPAGRRPARVAVLCPGSGPALGTAG